MHPAVPEVFVPPEERPGEGVYDRLPTSFPGYRGIYPSRRLPSPVTPPPGLVVGHWQNNTQPIYFDRQAFIGHLMDPSHRLSMIDSITLDDAVELINSWYARQGFFLTNKGWIPSLNHRSTSHRSVRRCSGLRQCATCRRFYSNKRTKGYCTTHRHTALTHIPCKFSITFQWNCQPGHEDGILSAVVSPHSFENGMVCMHSHPCITRKAAQRDDEARARQAAVAEELTGSPNGFPRPFGVRGHGIQLRGTDTLLPPLSELSSMQTVQAVQAVQTMQSASSLSSLPSLQTIQTIRTLPHLAELRPFDLDVHSLSGFSPLDDDGLPLGLTQPLQPLAPLRLSMQISQDVEQPITLHAMPVRLSCQNTSIRDRGSLPSHDEIRSLPASMGEDPQLPRNSMSAPLKLRPRSAHDGSPQRDPPLSVLSPLTAPFSEPLPGGTVGS